MRIYIICLLLTLVLCCLLCLFPSVLRSRLPSFCSTNCFRVGSSVFHSIVTFKSSCIASVERLICQYSYQLGDKETWLLSVNSDSYLSECLELLGQIAVRQQGWWFTSKRILEIINDSAGSGRTMSSERKSHRRKGVAHSWPKFESCYFHQPKLYITLKSLNHSEPRLRKGSRANKMEKENGIRNARTK